MAATHWLGVPPSGLTASCASEAHQSAQQVSAQQVSQMHHQTLCLALHVPGHGVIRICVQGLYWIVPSRSCIEDSSLS